MSRSRVVAVGSSLTLALGLAGCMNMDGDGAVPAAPTLLTSAVLSGGAHLTWKDNANDETQFMVPRMEVGGSGGYKTVASPTFDTIQYHDAPLVAGKTYVYTVMAMNNSGESMPSNETRGVPSPSSFRVFTRPG